ncbi:MAG: radical SAM protein [candidate division WOR-3 bacterium]
MIDLLLVNPKDRGTPFELIPPLGLAYIAACARAGGFSVKLFDYEVEQQPLEKHLAELQPRVVGISGTTHTRYQSFDIARRVKRFSSEIKTVFGGVHASFTGRDTLAHVPDVDIVVRGEGEESMTAILRTLKAGQGELAHIPGLLFRENGGIVETGPPVRIQDIDVLPGPAWDLLAMNRYALKMEFLNKRGIAFISSRGCTMQCTFCSASAMYGHDVTCHSPVYVLDQLQVLIEKYGYEGIRFFDSTITLRRSHVEGICAEIERRGLTFPWECEIRVGTVDRPLLERMRRAGCYYVDFGIESASQRVLDTMCKGFRLERAEELLNWCEDLGLKTKVFFSIGHIGETMADVEQTFRFIEQHRRRISTLACGAGVRIYPGTYLETYAREQGLLPPDFSWSEIYSDPRLVDLSQDPSIPLLLQPGLGVNELSAIRLRIIGQRFRGWAGVKALLGKLFQRQSWSKLGAAVRLCLMRVTTRSAH